MLKAPFLSSKLEKEKDISFEISNKVSDLKNFFLYTE